MRSYASADLIETLFIRRQKPLAKRVFRHVGQRSWKLQRYRKLPDASLPTYKANHASLAFAEGMPEKRFNPDLCAVRLLFHERIRGRRDSYHDAVFVARHRGSIDYVSSENEFIRTSAAIDRALVARSIFPSLRVGGGLYRKRLDRAATVVAMMCFCDVVDSCI